MLRQVARLVARTHAAEPITGCTTTAAACAIASSCAAPSPLPTRSCKHSSSSSSSSSSGGGSDEGGAAAGGGASGRGDAPATGSSLFSEYVDPDYTEVTDMTAQVFQGNKRVSKGSKKAAKALTRGPERTLRRETIPVPPAVRVMQRGTRLYFSGPLGVNAIDLERMDSEGMAAFRVGAPTPSGDSEILVAGPSSAAVGTIASLIRNKITGVVQGYLVYLQLVGVGYRVAKETREVTYTVGK